MHIFTVSDISTIEKLAIEKLGIPEILLMENAASAVFNTVTNLDFKPKKIAVLCGFGNNGGDGFACARMLAANGFETTVFYFEDIKKFSPLALLNYNILKHSKIKLIPFKKPYDFLNYDLIIDALFGTGLKRFLDGNYKEIINAANDSEAYKIAIDIPSGLIADNCSIEGTTIRADITVTFIAMKICQSLYPSKALCGRIITDNLTIPQTIIQQASELTYSTINTLPTLKKRKSDTHKGDYGHALIVGGSFGMGGAVYMASVSALRCGAGLVSAAYPSVCDKYFSSTPEIMTFPINCDSYFTEIDADSIIQLIEEKNISVVCIGNGLARKKSTSAFMKRLIRSSKKPFIIDADGINALDISDLEFLKGRTILTPHLGEFARITKKSIEEVKYSRPQIATNFAIKHGIVLVLKSSETIIASPTGKTIISDYGIPALAKGGSGDCLAGIITGLVAQGYTLEDSSELASFILGRSACIAEKEFNENTIIVSDIIKYFKESMNELQKNT